MALGRPDRAGPDLRRGPRLPVGEGTQDGTAAIRLHRTMGRQNRQVQRRLGAVAGKGMTDALQISPTTRSKARSTAFIRSSSSRPKGLLIFERGRVESLSTITCESTRNPLTLSGSTVMRKAASRTALVTGQLTRLSSSAKRFDCTMRAGRGLRSEEAT